MVSYFFFTDIISISDEETEEEPAEEPAEEPTEEPEPNSSFRKFYYYSAVWSDL